MAITPTIAAVTVTGAPSQRSHTATPSISAATITASHAASGLVSPMPATSAATGAVASKITAAGASDRSRNATTTATATPTTVAARAAPAAWWGSPDRRVNTVVTRLASTGGTPATRANDG